MFYKCIVGNAPLPVLGFLLDEGLQTTARFHIEQLEVGHPSCTVFTSCNKQAEMVLVATTIVSQSPSPA